MSALKLFLFGSPRVELDETPVDIKRRKALALLCYLAASRQLHSRDSLATLFYPDFDQRRARAYLRRDLAVLNTSLNGEWLEADRETVELKSGFWLDVSHFRRLLAKCESHDHPPEVTCPDCIPLLTEAVNLYTNDFLAGFTLRDSAEFDDWQFFQAEGLRQELASTLERLVEGLSVQGDYDTAIPHVRRWVALDSLHEPAQRQLIQIYDQAGQRTAALRQYEEYTALLEEELGFPPEEETTTLYEALKAKRMLRPFVKAKEVSPEPQTSVGHGALSGLTPTPAKAKRYKLKEKIGRGGYATVYRALDHDLGREVALKELHSHLLADTGWVKRFHKEARTVARLDHPRIVPIYDVVGQAQEKHFIVMRLVEGPDLDHLLTKQRHLPWSEAIEIVRAVAEGLDYAHSQGILHRDLKPANILIDLERGPLLTDFNLAKLVSENSLSQSRDVVGTPHYIAPEGWEGQPATPQTDIYALGCILYEMLTGEKLFSGETPPAVMTAHFQLPIFPESWPEGTPSGVTKIFEKALAKDPNKRYATAGEMVEALTQLLEIQQPEAVSSEDGRPRHNLPFQPTPFVGREPELARIRQYLVDESACRMVTLVGPGGVGKTRLALEAATQLLQDFPQGVYFVSLASVSEANLIVSAIAKALDFIFSGTSDPKSQLLNYLHEKELLLVIDNFEHLLEGADILSDILNAAPQATLLVTSRERLNLPEEWGIEVRGMAFPHLVQAVSKEDLAALEKYSAVQLFIQRARRAKAGFNLSVEDIPALVRICELVDGMPLGLELAAPWVRLMTCREIATEIERNIDILNTSLHDVPERHRSLRAVFEQTWERLLPEEQAVLSKLSVFQGGGLREAAEAVTGATLPHLLSLVDKALLRRTSGGRYEMHELIRQFAEEQLRVNSEEYKQALDRHYVYYTCFLQQRTGALKGGRQKETLAEISAEIDNVRAAWQRAIELKDAAAVEPAAECLCLYSEMRGALDEGEAAFSQAAAAFAPTDQIDTKIAEEQTILRGFLLVGQGMLRAHRGDLKGGQALLEQGLSLFRQSNDHQRHLPQKAFALMWLGWTLFLQAENSEAEQITQESLNLFSEIGDRWGVAKSLFVLGNSLTGRGQLNEAEPPLRESLTIFQEIDDRRNCLLVNRNIAILTFWFGDYAQTGQLLDQAAMLSREFDDQIGLAYALRELGKLEAAQGKYAQAIQTLQKSIAITDEIGSHWESAVSHDDLGVALRQTGDYVAAEWALSRCLEASQALNHRYFTARCLGDLGCVAYHRGEYQLAEQRLQQALELWAQIGHEPYSAWVLCQLGYVMAAADGDRKEEAKQFFAQVLQLSVRHRLAPFALDAFVGIAGLLACAGEKQYATHLLSLAEQHAASAYETTEEAHRLLNELKTDTADGVLTPDQEPGQALDWQVMAEQTIEVLSTLPG